MRYSTTIDIHTSRRVSICSACHRTSFPRPAYCCCRFWLQQHHRKYPTPEAPPEIPLLATPLPVRSLLLLLSFLRLWRAGLFATRACPTLRFSLFVLLDRIVYLCLTIASISAWVMLPPYNIVRCSNTYSVVSTSTIFKFTLSIGKCTPKYFSTLITLSTRAETSSGPHSPPSLILMKECPY